MPALVYKENRYGVLMCWEALYTVGRMSVIRLFNIAWEVQYMISLRFVIPRLVLDNLYRG